MTADSTASASVHRVKSSASTASEYGYPHGHLGHLNQHEEEQFHAFKALLAQKKLYTPGPPPSHEDPVLLRFLRARRWVVQDAFRQFKDTEEWRAANDINVLYHTIELEAYEQSRRLYPQWTGRRDRRGIPLYVFEIHSLDSKTIANYEKLGATTTFSKAKTDGKTSPGMLRLFALYENLTRFNQVFCTQLQDREFPGTPITMSTNIVDISNVSLRQFWNLKGHMQAASQLATAHYPETLDRIFIIGAPMFFSTVWGWIKRWFDPITVSKIFVLSHSEALPTMTAFVDPKNIPKKYGGELEFRFGDVPTIDPAWSGVVQFENGHKSFPVGPMIWREIEGGERLECIGLGSVNGVERMERIATIPKTWPAKEEAKKPEDAAERAETQVNGVVIEVPMAVAEPDKAKMTAAPVITPAQTNTETKPDPDVVQGDITELSSLEDVRPVEKEGHAPTTTSKGTENLTVSEVIVGTTSDEVSEKVVTSDVSPAVPTTVA